MDVIIKNGGGTTAVAFLEWKTIEKGLREGRIFKRQLESCPCLRQFSLKCAREEKSCIQRGRCFKTLLNWTGWVFPLLIMSICTVFLPLSPPTNKHFWALSVVFSWCRSNFSLLIVNCCPYYIWYGRARCGGGKQGGFVISRFRLFCSVWAPKCPNAGKVSTRSVIVTPFLRAPNASKN